MGNCSRLLVLIALILPLVPAAPLSAQHAAASPWQMQTSNTTAGLRGIHAVNSKIAWASGTNGTVLRTTDGGQHWQRCATPPDAAKLDFRSIWAWDANTAMVMSSGPGALSRLYKTTDACKHWRLVYTNPDKSGFWDDISFSGDYPLPPRMGELLGDPVGGYFTIFDSEDNGDTWHRVVDPGLRSLPDEGLFAASNSSLSADWDDGIQFFGTGGPLGPRLFYNCDPCLRAAVFTASPMPLFPKGKSAGIFSIAYRYVPVGQRFLHIIIAVGGDYTKPNDPTGTAAWSSDGGRTWHAATHPPHGYRSAVAWDPSPKAWIAAGTNGSDVSYDDGKTWRPLDNGNWNALSLSWVVGPSGRIARLDSHLLPTP